MSVGKKKDVREVDCSLLGKLCRDKVTEFVGVATAVAVHLYGCNTVCLMAKVDDKNKKDDNGSGWYDEGRLEVIEDHVTPKDVKAPSGKGAGKLDMPENKH